MNRNLELPYTADREIDGNQERIERSTRIKGSSAVTNVGDFLVAAKMNSNTVFSMEENLIKLYLLFSCDSMCWIPYYMTVV